MDSKNFIIEKLKGLYADLSYLEIRYEFRVNIATHLIEVKPVHCYNKDKAYILKQIAIENQFEELFSNEEILFMSENILIQIEKPILELGISLIEQKSQIVTASYSIEHIMPKSNVLEEVFDSLSKVNINSPIYHYVNYSMNKEFVVTAKPCVNVILNDYYMNESPHFKEEVVAKETKTKKDSEINQSLFFFY